MQKENLKRKGGNQGRFGRNGFTVVELLIVIIILAVLSGTLFTKVPDFRNEAYYSVVRNNLKEYARALGEWRRDFKFEFGREPVIGVGRAVLNSTTGDFSYAIFNAYVSSNLSTTTTASSRTIARYQIHGDYIGFYADYRTTSALLSYEGQPLQIKWR